MHLNASRGELFGYGWVIIVGAIMLTPRGPICIACGQWANIALAVITIGVGVAGLAGALRSRSVAGR